MRLGLVVPAALAGGLLLACGAYQPASVEYVAYSPVQPRLGQSTTIQFRALDDRGLPQPGATLHFRLQNPVPGVTLSPDTGTTDKSTGVASTQVIATTRVTSIVVIAEAGTKVAVSPPISFAGGAASARQFTFQCGPLAGTASGGIHAIGAYDQTRFLIAGIKLECTAHVGDRNGDGVPDTVVSFLTEAGTIGPSQTSVTDVIGNATILYKTSYPLPQPTDPGTFSFNPVKDSTHIGQYLAPLWMHPFDWKNNPVADFNLPPDMKEPNRIDPITGLKNNPRDNLVTMIAVTSGEESFTDLNDNGVWDTGEPFEDTTEPFVDANDNGTWDPGELYVDTNGNGKWDGKNGQHDASTLIWAQERILWTGIPDDRDFQDNVSPIFKQISAPPQISHYGSAPVVLLISDPWFNTLAQNGNSDGCQINSNTAGHPLVIPDQQTFGETGQRFTYPPYMLARVNLTDAHDPQQVPAAPAFSPPIGFVVGVTCTFTASPDQGEPVGIAVPAISGTVQ